MEHGEQNPMSKAFPVTSISREDLLHPAVGFTVNEARMVSDEQMREIARRLGKSASNQIVKSAIKIVTNAVIHYVQPNKI
jgi:hypothetical protein